MCVLCSDENDKCTLYLNETESHSDYSILRPHFLGDLERIQFLHLKELNSSIHSNVVARKGPKIPINHHHKYKKLNSVKSERKNNRKYESIEHEEWDIDSKQKAQKDFNQKNKEIGEQEWILNKNNPNEQMFQGELEHYVVDDLHLNEDFINVEKINNDPWILKDKEEIIEIPSFTEHDSYIRNNDPEILKRY